MSLAENAKAQTFCHSERSEESPKNFRDRPVFSHLFFHFLLDLLLNDPAKLHWIGNLFERRLRAV
jgi:hypothetical protein